MKNKRTLFNLYKDIVLVTRVRIFCTTLFTNNNIKVVIQINAFLTDCKHSCCLCLPLCPFKNMHMPHVPPYVVHTSVSG